jgi:hypothetical protein
MKHYAYDSPFEMKDNEGNEYMLTVEYDELTESPREWDNLCTMVCWHCNYSLGDKHGYDDVDEFFSHILHHICGMDYEDFDKLNTDENYRLICESNKLLIKPINLYDHGSITVSISNGYPYNDRWDSCCVGFIYVTKEKIFKEGCCLRVKDDDGNYIRVEHKHEGRPSTYSYKTTPATEDNWKEIAFEIIEAEMETYDQYVQGEVYWFKLEKKVIKQELCPHCGEIIHEYEDTEEVDSCGGFYGDCLEENGILGNIGSDIKFVED